MKQYLQNFFQIYDKDWRKVIYFSVINFILTGTGTLGVMISTSMFIKRIGVESLPKMYIANAAVMLACTVLYLALSSGIVERVLFKWLAFTFGLIVLLARFFLLLGHFWIIPVLYVIANLTTWIFFTQFWAAAVEVCNVRESRRIFPYLVGVGLLGGMITGFNVNYFISFLNTDNLLFAWSFALFVIAKGFKSKFGHENGNGSEPPKPEVEPFKDLSETTSYLFKNRLARTIIMTFLLYSFTVYLLDFQFNRIVNLVYTDEERLMRFYGIYSVWLYGCTFLLQMFLTSRIVKWLGIGNTMLSFPIVLAAGFAALAVKFKHLPGVSAKFLRDLVGNSLVDSAYPILFSPLDEKQRTKALSLVEGILIPIGTGLAGVTLLILKDFNPKVISLFGVIASAVWIYLSWRLRSAYHDAFMDRIISKTYHVEDKSMEEYLDLTHGTTLAVLRKAMDDSNQKVSLFAIATLGDTRDKAAIKPLVELLARTDLDPMRKATAVKALGKIKEESNLPVISRFLNDSDERVRANAVESLGEVGGENVRILVQPLLKDANARVRINAATVLWKNGEQEKALETLSEILSHSDEEDVMRAVFSLSLVATPELLPLLVRASKHKSGKVRAQALTGLSKMDNPEAKKRLIELLADNNRVVREKAFSQLAKAENVLHDLLDALHFAPERVQEKAALILAERREPQSLEPLLEYCDWQIRIAYQRVIDIEVLFTEKIQVPAVELLLESLRVRNEQTVTKVVKIVSKLENSPGLAFVISRVRENEQMRAEVLELIDSSDLKYKSLLKLILPLIDDMPVEQKISLAQSKWGLEWGYFRGTLKKIIHQDDEWLKSCGLYVAGEVRDKEFLDLVVQETGHHSGVVRETALKALANINQHRGRMLAQSLLTDPSEYVREVAQSLADGNGDDR